jgi:hypothetical protein
MPDIEFIRREIVRLRAQVHRQRREITKLQTAGILASSADALLSRMVNRLSRLKNEQPPRRSGRGRLWQGGSTPALQKRRFQSPLLDQV